MSYELKLHRDIEKQLARIPEKARERLVQAMRSLCDEPRPAGCIKLEDQLYRLRQGQYRIIYAIFDREIIVFICKVARRTGTTYRDLQQMLDSAIQNVIEK